MSNYRKGWLAIVCAYRKGETDLSATLESAAKSAGQGSVMIAVEDKDGSGPGYNRNRGIEAADGAESVILIDAHMRFRGDVLRRMGRQVKTGGGLLVPYCYNNEAASFTGKPYAGARMVWGSRDDDIHQSCALVAKWSKDDKPGPRTAVMGACYAFRRDWYYRVGQPLSILRGWGCDEELLSIAAWMSGTAPELIVGHVAHRYRSRPPWEVATIEHQRATENRRRMIASVVTDERDRRDLYGWQGNQDVHHNDESVRLRDALLRLPRKWDEWKRAACEPAEINGVPCGRVECKIPDEQPRQRLPTIVTPLGKTRCPHCGSMLDPYKLSVSNTYPNGRRRHKCPICARPFISMFNATA